MDKDIEPKDVDVTPEIEEDVTPAEPVKEEPTTRRGMFSKIYHKFLSNKDSHEDPVDNVDDVNGDEEVNEDVDPDNNEVTISEEVKRAATAAGWSEEKIAKYAKDDPEVLETLAKLYDDTVSVDDVPTPPVSIKKEKEEKKNVLDKSAIAEEDLRAIRDQYGDEVVDKVVTPLVDKLNSVIDIVNAQSEQGQAVQKVVDNVTLQHREREFHSQLDQLSEAFPVFGKWENVPRNKKGEVDLASPAFKARAEVWIAADGMQKMGMDWGRALSNAVALYKGRHLEDQIRSQVIAKLNKQKKQFSPRPTSKKTTPVKLQGKAARLQEFRAAAEKAGIKFN